LPPPALIAYTVAVLAAVLTRNDTPLVVVRGVVDACFGLAPSWRRRHAAAAAARRFARLGREELSGGSEEFATGGSGDRRSRMEHFLRADNSFGDLAAAWEVESAAGAGFSAHDRGFDDALSVGSRRDILQLPGGAARGTGTERGRPISPSSALAHPADEQLSPDNDAGQGRVTGEVSGLLFSSARSMESRTHSSKVLSAIHRVATAREPPNPQLAPFFLQPSAVFRLLRWAIGAPRARAVLQTFGVEAPTPARAGDTVEILGPLGLMSKKSGQDGFAGVAASEQSRSGHRTAMLISGAHAGLI